MPASRIRRWTAYVLLAGATWLAAGYMALAAAAGVLAEVEEAQ